MKNKVKPRSIEFQRDVKSILVPIIILTLFGVLIGVSVVTQLASLSNKPSGISEDDRLWEQAFYEAEKNRVGIIFDSMNTTDTDYTKLREACNEYIQENEEGKSVDANIEVDTVVDEKQFIDGNKNEVKKENKELSETGPIYFQDMLMLRYINSDGTLKVITSLFDNKRSIQVARQNKLGEVVGRNRADNKSETSVSDNKVEQSRNYTTELEYIESIDKTLKEMLLANTFEEIRSAESLAMNYFTVEGKQTVFGNRKDIKLSEGSTIETLFIEAGKSDSSKTYKDRIYTQLRVTVGNEEFDTYIILKLNNILRIYDIDII